MQYGEEHVPYAMKAFLEQLIARRLGSYTAEPGRLKEDAGREDTVLAGGYGYRQVLELVQNGADALLEQWEQNAGSSEVGRIHVQLHDGRLYVANTGAPLTVDGIEALLSSDSSPKRGNQIGRFGLGFKSLLKLGGRIDVFSRQLGAMRFDPERCRRELRERFKVPVAPRLRLAWSLDDEERTRDSVCNALGWAETIVRVEVEADDLLEHLHQEIHAFPAEFLLFFPVPTVLTLDDGQARREIRLLDDGPDRMLHDGAGASRWRIVQREVQVADPRARDDATHIHARDSVPVAWAMPLEGRRDEAGRFWAFFPTKTPTYLPGIVNAPWKLNSDRNAIIGGEWNRALMLAAATLIAESLPGLSSLEDPSRPLDAFPRQLARSDEDAAPLVEATWKHLETAAVIPDANGALRTAFELQRHPRDTPALAQMWQGLADDKARARLIHPNCLEKAQRNSRLKALAERMQKPHDDQTAAALGVCAAASWFAAIASTETATALEVLKLAKNYKDDTKSGEWESIRRTLAIVPTALDTLVTPDQAVLAPAGVAVPGRTSVEAGLEANADARDILVNVLQISEPDSDLWLSVLREALPKRDSNTDADWRRLWERLRVVPADVQRRFLQQSDNEVRVRRRDGRWARADGVLLPGKLVNDDDSAANLKILVDDETHAADGALLDILGVSDLPKGNIGPAKYREVSRDGDPLLAWLATCRRRYKEEQQNSGRDYYLEPSPISMPRGFALLIELADTANARFTLHMIACLTEPPYKEPVHLAHATTPKKYATIEVMRPLPWFLLSHGRVEVGSGISVPLGALVARRGEPALRSWVAKIGDEAALASLSEAFPATYPRAEDLRKLWNAAIGALATEDALTNGTLTDLWQGAGQDGVVPAALHTKSGLVALDEVCVTTSADLAQRARAGGRVVVALDEPTMKLWVSHGAKDLANLMEVAWESEAGGPQRLVDVVPELADALRPAVQETVLCQYVVGLKLRIDGTSHPRPCLLRDGTLYLDAEQLMPLSRGARLRCLIEEIDPAGWLDSPAQEMLQRVGDAKVDERRASVAEGATLADRLLRAVGGRPEPLLVVLGTSLKDQDFIRNCSPQMLAELVLAQLGPTTLSRLQSALAQEGLKPPARWGTADARNFVTRIGFPEEFAASAESQRNAEELVSGPIELPPLHDFQHEVFDGLGALMACGTGRRRAVVSLPTGGGKTRVAVQAAVQLVLAPEGERRSALWVAQTDELCEQAVQAFRQVWVNLGAKDTDLRIVRLWGGNRSPAKQESGNPVVVVASIQTLNNRLDLKGLDWLSEPGLVVVDECHHAIAPSYTSLLRWLDAEAPRPGAPTKDEPPIIGLSATPFRVGDDESERLARRFDRRWLPDGQEQLYAKLLQQGVLASPRYEQLDGVALTSEQLDQIGQYDLNSEATKLSNVLDEINKDLGNDRQRNERLVRYIQDSQEQSILLFANSVEHSVEMAARLQLTGITAAAISGDTPTAARRWFLQRFQQREIRVLCNYGVLTTGFDAPKTDMVLIARLVFSPVRYMQMVGRGLRGERNGGTPSCRIVTVKDNLGRFQDRHPYHYCREYFAAPNGPFLR